MRSQEPFSFEQHRDAADLLTRLRDEVARLERDLGQSYGPNTAADAHSVVGAIDRLRARLHSQLGRDFPRDAGQVSSIRLGSIYAPARWTESHAAG